MARHMLHADKPARRPGNDRRLIAALWQSHGSLQDAIELTPAVISDGQGRHGLKLLRLRGIIQHCVNRNFAKKLPHHPWYFASHKEAASEFCCKIPRQVKQRRKQWPLPEAGCANLRINIQTGPDARKSASGPKRSVNTWFSCCRGFRQKHR